MKSRFKLLLFALAGLVVAFAPLPFSAIRPQERTFRIEARQYAYSPSELQVNPGDTVTIQLVSTDVVHGLYVDGYDLSIEADPGQAKTLTFVADKPGSFRFFCSRSGFGGTLKEDGRRSGTDPPGDRGGPHGVRAAGAALPGKRAILPGTAPAGPGPGG